MSGGLGNQLFQYGVGRMLSNKLNTDLYIDKYTPNNPRPFVLNVYNIDLNYISVNELNILRPKEIKEPHFNYYTKIENVKGDVYLKGYWQSYKYIDPIRDILLDELVIKNNLKRDFGIVNEIVDTNSVSVHFRRGDYVKVAHTKKYHGVCSMEYYRNAINKIKEKVEDPKFYVFSDDIEWVRFNWPKDASKNYVCVSNSHELRDFEDMYIMSRCKHNITANSSFSWWAAWLNRNPDKIVISPYEWFKNKDVQDKTHDLIPPSWVRL